MSAVFNNARNAMIHLFIVGSARYKLYYKFTLTIPAEPQGVQPCRGVSHLPSAALTNSLCLAIQDVESILKGGTQVRNKKNALILNIVDKVIGPLFKWRCDRQCLVHFVIFSLKLFTEVFHGECQPAVECTCIYMGCAHPCQGNLQSTATDMHS